MRILRPFAFAFLFATVGCGVASDVSEIAEDQPAGGASPGDPPGANTTDPASSAEPLPDPIVELPEGVEERRVLEAIAPNQLKELYRLVGRYARGDAPIYEGTFAAKDNRGSLGAGNKDGVMESGMAIAGLTSEEQVHIGGAVPVAGWSLIVRGATQGVRINQSPSAAGVTAITHLSNGSFGVVGTCNGCFPSLNPAASALSTTNAVAVGTWGTGTRLEVSVNGSLTRIPRTQVTFERIAAVVEYPYVMEEFQAAGGDMVRSVTGRLVEPMPVPQGKTFHSCERVTPYKLDWFVDSAKLVRHGLRNMSITQAQTCCNEQPPGACQPQVCF